MCDRGRFGSGYLNSDLRLDYAGIKNPDGNNAERMFDHMDENEDGAISQDEYDAAGEGRGGRHGGKGGRDRG